MKAYQFFLGMTALLCSVQTAYGIATERLGPDKDHKNPTVAQPEWPARMLELLRHDARVYSVWVNGDEVFYFNGNSEEIGQLINLFSQIHLRDHVVTIKEGRKEAITLGRDKIAYNVEIQFLGGIARAVTGQNRRAETYEPTLTIYLDPARREHSIDRAAVPRNVIVKSETVGWKASSENVPSRRLWHARVIFDSETPAADFENGVSTKVTLWQEGAETGFNLGKVNHLGTFTAAFSDREIADLREGSMWLTLTVGNYLTAANQRDPRLKVADLSLDSSSVRPVRVTRPKMYFGRLLFEDGSPAILAPPPWPGGRISLDFPYAGRTTLGEDGYFSVFFTPEQFATLKTKPIRKNIYIPDFESKGRSTARYSFPVTGLSLMQEDASEIRIPRPRPDASSKR